MCEVIRFQDAIAVRYARAVSRMDELCDRIEEGRPTQETIDGLIAAEREAERHTLTLVNLGLTAPEIARLSREYA